jgi:hypothetical protein
MGMTDTASTAQQVILLVLFVLPGTTYQFVRERSRGRVPGGQDFSERVLRALTASIALDALYVIVAGPQLVRLIKPAGGMWFAAAVAHPRQAAGLSLALFLAIPAAAAWCISLLERRRYPSRFDPVPTAWDSAFRSRAAGFVRVRMKSGVWVGGWYGRRSRASSFPSAADLYLESAYEMVSDGTFGQRVQATAGIYINMNEVEALEFLEVPDAE